MSLRPEQLERYARHIILREIGGPGQKRLLDAKVLVIGAGGLGSPVLLYLAAAGVGQISVIDDDTVSLSNLQRQILFRSADVEAPKVARAAAALAELNPDCVVETVAARLTAENAASLVARHDLVLDGSDNFDTRRLVNASCVAAAKPLVMGAIGQWEGQVSVLDPARGGPCYACLFPEDPAPGLAPSCAEAGVVGALAGVIGSMMALEAIKIITRAGEPARGALLLYDGLYAETRRIEITRDPACPICQSADP